jgi:hypothetical protein
MRWRSVVIRCAQLPRAFFAFLFPESEEVPALKAAHVADDESIYQDQPPESADET